MFTPPQGFSHGIKDNGSIERLGRGYKSRPACADLWQWRYGNMPLLPSGIMLNILTTFMLIHSNMAMCNGFAIGRIQLFIAMLPMAFCRSIGAAIWPICRLFRNDCRQVAGMKSAGQCLAITYLAWHCAQPERGYNGSFSAFHSALG